MIATARVLTGPADFPAFQPGEVLVAAITTPAWTSLFPRAAAVVTDIGGPLSHSSIVAREYGIPAVLGTGSATRRIRTGDTVTVNGERGCGGAAGGMIDDCGEVPAGQSRSELPRYRRTPGRTTFSRGWPAAKRSSCCLTSRSARGVNAELAPPTCGVITTFGTAQSGWSDGSGSGSVTSRAARSLPLLVSASRASVSTSPPRATLTTSAPSGSPESAAASTMFVVSGVSGAMMTRTSASGSRSRSRSEPWTSGSVRGRRATRVTEATERPQPRLDGGPDPPVPKDQHPEVGQRRPGQPPPHPALLLTRVHVELTSAGQDQREGELGGAGVVDAGGVAQRDGWPEVRNDVVDAGREGLHDREARQPAEQVAVDAAQVRQDDELDLPGRVGQLPPSAR